MRTAGNPEASVPSEVLAQDGARTTGPALEAHDRFLLWLVTAVGRFPRQSFSGFPIKNVGNDRRENGGHDRRER